MSKKSYKVDLKQLQKFRLEAVTGDHKMIIDQPAYAGGENAGPTPLEYLLTGLGACIMTMIQVGSRRKRVEIRSISMEVEGILDTDGLTGRNPDIRTGFEEIIIKVGLDADLSDEEKLELIKDAEAKCPASDNIANATPIKLKLA